MANIGALAPPIIHRSASHHTGVAFIEAVRLFPHRAGAGEKLL
ncbi:MAG: hypothetical protein ACUVX8_04335 [Candidatus Zipacnadales bacterium]